MARLISGAEGTISMAFLVMCAEKILRLLGLFFTLLYAWLCSLLAPLAHSCEVSTAFGSHWSEFLVVV